MKTLLKVIFSLLSLLLVLAILIYIVFRFALGQAFTEQPWVESFEKASIEDLKRVKKIVIDVSQQSSHQGNAPKTIELSERDINLAIAQFGPHQIDIPDNTFARVQLDDNQGKVELSSSVETLLLPLYEEQKVNLHGWRRSMALHAIELLENRWINLSVPVEVQQDGADIRLVPGAFTLGKITLSDNISQQIYNRLLTEAKKQNAYRQALASWKNIKALSIEDSLLKASFVIPQRAGNLPLSNYQALVLTKDEVQLIEIYTAALQKLPQRGPLTKVLSKLFTIAKDRANQTANPVAENRAALLALSKAYGGDQLAALVGQRDPRAALRLPKPFTIYRRTDLAQHMVLSSAASLLADENIAELIGVDKELNDLLGGSRISAWDLLADKAGIRLAQKATENAKSARELQVYLSRIKKDSDILPDLGPEFSGQNDRFDANQLGDLNEMISLSLEQHRLYR